MGWQHWYMLINAIFRGEDWHYWQRLTEEFKRDTGLWREKKRTSPGFGSAIGQVERVQLQKSELSRTKMALNQQMICEQSKLGHVDTSGLAQAGWPIIPEGLQQRWPFGNFNREKDLPNYLPNYLKCGILSFKACSTFNISNILVFLNVFLRMCSCVNRRWSVRTSGATAGLSQRVSTPCAMCSIWQSNEI